MCFKVSNTSDMPISVIYSQWVTTAETRHRLKVYAHDEMTILLAASVEPQDGLDYEQLEDLAAPLPEDGPV